MRAGQPNSRPDPPGLGPPHPVRPRARMSTAYSASTTPPCRPASGDLRASRSTSGGTRASVVPAARASTCWRATADWTAGWGLGARVRTAGCRRRCLPRRGTRPQPWPRSRWSGSRALGASLRSWRSTSPTCAARWANWDGAGRRVRGVHSQDGLYRATCRGGGGAGVGERVGGFPHGTEGNGCVWLTLLRATPGLKGGQIA